MLSICVGLRGPVQQGGAMPYKALRCKIILIGALRGRPETMPRAFFFSLRLNHLDTELACHSMLE